MVSAQNQNVLRAAQNAATNTRRPTGKPSVIFMCYGDMMVIWCRKIEQSEASK